ncbi:MAG: hypothetical protein CM15mP120_14460 [Pseudomonadota bacterium]|nr:MAG: hypothetical protein CM15mP120_14460 [Pseudomonadota bacterium]
MAVQHGQAIFTMSISFQVTEDGLSHQFPMPETPGPDNLLGEEEVRAEQAKNWPEEFQETFSGSSAIELRPVEPLDLMNPQKTDPTQRCWMRCGETLPDDPRLHQCVLAYLSDWSLLDTATRPHGISFLQDNIQVASLDTLCGFTVHSAPTNGCCTTKTAPAPAAPRLQPWSNL